MESRAEKSRTAILHGTVNADPASFASRRTPAEAAEDAPLPLASAPPSSCLLLEEDSDGWTGLYCFQGREGAPETAAYLNRHYPDGLARLFPLGDLVALGGRPGLCDAADSDGEYLPARDPNYPPTGATAEEVCAAFGAIKTDIRFACLYEPATGRWRATSARGAGEPSPNA